MDRHKTLGATRTPYENTTVYSQLDAVSLSYSLDPLTYHNPVGRSLSSLIDRWHSSVHSPPWGHSLRASSMVARSVLRRRTQVYGSHIVYPYRQLTYSNPSALSFSCNIWLSERPDLANTVAEVATALKLDNEVR